MSMIIIGKDCEECVHCVIHEESKARVKVACQYRDGKEFFWGQNIPCENKVKRKKEEITNEENC